MKPSEALEKLILVTVDDKEIGSLGKEEVHREGLLHRAFSVFLNGRTENTIPAASGPTPAVLIRERGRRWKTPSTDA